MRVIVTGSRDWTDYDAIYAALVAIKPRPAVLVEGGARGADALAVMAARRLGIKVETHRADWRSFGRAAGPIRNQDMADLGGDLLLAFLLPQSVGTVDMIRRCRKSGIPVKEFKGHNG